VILGRQGDSSGGSVSAGQGRGNGVSGRVRDRTLRGIGAIQRLFDEELGHFRAQEAYRALEVRRSEFRFLFVLSGQITSYTG
jgi:hypothetical protein